ncbi:MAG: thiamine-phosphate kinase [Hymenobacteraceae bacterium]|nr:thiamine-phosphate kinase [Hymenobacteraceae bacterium]
MAETPTSLTPLDSLGEFGLIRRLRAQVAPPHQASTISGIGDDAAVLRPTAGRIQVITTDLLLEGVHFDLTFCPLRHLGYKAVAVNVSDVAAMNARPTQLVVGLAVGARFTVEAVEELYAGMRLACEAYGVDLVGGDTTSSPSGHLLISVTALGEAEEPHVTRRSGAQPNDLICVTGDLGAAYLGLQVLTREKQAFLADPEHRPDLEPYTYVVQRQLRPEARMDVIHALADLGVVPTAMLDISDGLASEVLHLCENSTVGAAIYQDKLPLADETLEVAEEFKLDPVTCALNGGEDYELLFTIPLAQHDQIRNHPDITVIGHVLPTGQGAYLMTPSGAAVKLQAQGWTAF